MRRTWFGTGSCARSSRLTPTTRAVDTASSRLAVDISLGGHRVPLSADRIRDLVRRTLIAERVREAMISVALVSSREIAKLNREHLGHAGPTDVISFALGSGPGADRDTERASPAGATAFGLRRALRGHTSGSAAGPSQQTVVGDIYICPDVVRKNAGHYGGGMREELARVVVHGTLHALGYDHEPGEDRVSSDMWRKQERIWPMSSSAAVARPAGLDQLLADFDAGKSAALARVVSIVENHRPGFDEILGRLHTKLGRARRIGITGPPGAGKSTLSTLLVRELRSAGHRVGVVAVDPTSPFTGGALLGDRVRMESVALDTGVFIRSMATRGSLGGLAAATREVADVLDAFGFERIIVETVGVGQSELDIARIADSSVVVLVPESGDSIQTLKAGLMEIADIFVVNKADRPGSDRLRMDIELMLGLRSGATMKNMPAHHGVDMKAVNPARVARKAAQAQIDQSSADQNPKTTNTLSWTPPVFSTIASKGEGVVELLQAIDAHFAYLEVSGGLRERRRRRLRDRVVDVVEERVRSRLWKDSETQQWLDGRVEEMESGSATPFTVADELLEKSGGLIAKRDTRQGK